jgi:hypothetical protein
MKAGAMASESRDSTVKTHEEILARIRGLTAGIRDGAAAAEEARAFEVDRRFPNLDIVVTSGVLPVEHLPANAKFIAKPWRGLDVLNAAQHAITAGQG